VCLVGESSLGPATKHSATALMSKGIFRTIRQSGKTVTSMPGSGLDVSWIDAQMRLSWCLGVECQEMVTPYSVFIQNRFGKSWLIDERGPPTSSTTVQRRPSPLWDP
jgi:hypothetical protein